MSKRFASAAILTVLFLSPAIAGAVPISGIGDLGSFTGTFEVVVSDDMNATVTISLTNTSPAANGGFITAFVFNTPSGVDVTSASLGSTSAGLDELLGGPSFDNSVSGVPNGQFDIGASTGGSFQGSGNPTVGIGVGETETFTFSLFAMLGGFTGLTAQDFLDSLSVGPGDGEGVEDFVVRFRGFEDGDSDKVPNDNPPDEDVPEPSTIFLFGLGAAALVASRFRRS